MEGIFIKIKAVLLFTALFLLIFAIVGCSQDTTETDTDTDTSDTEETETDDTSDNDNNNEDKQTGETVLNIAIDAAPPTLDQPRTAATAARDTARMMFETLVTTDADFKPIPMLAESIDVSDDNKVYTFHLRQGVKFHNGKEMVAEDVIASMKRWLELTALSGELFDGATWEEKDDYTVVLELAVPSPLTLDTIATSKHAPAIMPKEVVESAPPEGVTEFIGTGPFKFVEWKQDQYIHFTKYEDYQPLDIETTGLGGKREALVDDVYFHLVPDSSTRLAGLQTGEYDFAYSIHFDNYDQLLNSDEIDPVLVPGSNTILKLNNVDRIMADPEFRKIINTALNYDEIMMAGFPNKDFYWLDSSYMHKDIKSWASQAGSDYHNINDPEKAKQMLEDYGYNGEEVIIMATRDYEYMYNIGVVVNEQLKAVGINSKLDVYDWPTLDEMESKTDLWDIEVMGISMVSTPPQLLMLSPSWAGGVNNPKIIEDMKAIENAANIEEAHKLWDALQQYVWEEHLPVINFGGGNTLYGISKKVQGFEAPLGAVFWNVSISE